MHDSSARLAALLRGERVDRPLFWEPWFAMGKMLQERYGGDLLAAAEELDWAAVKLPGVGCNVHFTKRVERIEATGVYYGGGELREPSQFAERPEPDWAAQVEKLLPPREAARQAGRLCWATLPWCFHAVATSMGLEHFAVCCYDRPEFVHQAMQWVEARNARAIEEVIARVRPDFILYDGDCAYKTGTMLRPEMMRAFCFEPTRPNAERLRDLGIPLAFHTDGKLDEVIPLLLDLGIAAVHGCEAQANDLSDLVTRFGDDIVLCGNMDVVFLHTATVAEVTAATQAMLTAGMGKGRYAAGCNTSPQDYLPPDNYLAMARAIRDWPPA